jgi:hypothetical protein
MFYLDRAAREIMSGYTLVPTSTSITQQLVQTGRVWTSRYTCWPNFREVLGIRDLPLPVSQSGVSAADYAGRSSLL